MLVCGNYRLCTPAASGKSNVYSACATVWLDPTNLGSRILFVPLFLTHPCDPIHPIYNLTQFVWGNKGLWTKKMEWNTTIRRNPTGLKNYVESWAENQKKKGGKEPGLVIVYLFIEPFPHPLLSKAGGERGSARESFHGLNQYPTKVYLQTT